MIDVLRTGLTSALPGPSGLPQKVVIYSHAFRNALIPVVTILTSWFVGIFGGSVVIESIFQWNGMGKVMIDGLRQLDFMVVLADADVLCGHHPHREPHHGFGIFSRRPSGETELMKKIRERKGGFAMKRNMSREKQAQVAA